MIKQDKLNIYIFRYLISLPPFYCSCNKIGGNTGLEIQSRS